MPSLQSLAYFHTCIEDRETLPDFIRDECKRMNLKDINILIHQKRPYRCFYKNCDDYGCRHESCNQSLRYFMMEILLD